MTDPVGRGTSPRQTLLQLPGPERDVGCSFRLRHSEHGQEELPGPAAAVDYLVICLASLIAFFHPRQAACSWTDLARSDARLKAERAAGGYLAVGAGPGIGPISA